VLDWRLPDAVRFDLLLRRRRKNYTGATSFGNFGAPLVLWLPSEGVAQSMESAQPVQLPCLLPCFELRRNVFWNTTLCLHLCTDLCVKQQFGAWSMLETASSQTTQPDQT